MRVFILIRVFKRTQSIISRRSIRIRNKNNREHPSNDERAMIETSSCIDQSDDVILYADERISMGLSFVLTPLYIDRYNIILALTHVAKKLYSNVTDATERNQLTKQFEHSMWKDYIKLNDDHQYRPNLPKRLADALRSLRNRDDVVVVKADKSPQSVVCKKCEQCTEGHRHLSDEATYTRCSAGDLNICDIVNNHLEEFVSKKTI
ncbi:hypothetical protein GJ496_010185 [Pomphorhynchus laevis]|nr:hypothetical protein GJ496_010185 [Pomphorhynchus laevis]